MEHFSQKELSTQVRPIPAYITERDQYYANGSPVGSAEVGTNSQFSTKSIHDYLQLLFKHRWLLVTAITLVVALTTLYSFLATPMYTATATLKIGTYNPLLPGTNAEDLLRQQTRERDYLNTQVQLLSGYTLADRAMSQEDIAGRLKNYVKKAKSSPLDLLNPIRLARSIFGSATAPKVDITAVGSDAIHTYRHSLEDLGRYLSFVEVSPVRKTSLVRVRVTTASPLLATLMANTHSESFIELTRDERQKNTLDNLVFLKSQAEELASKVALSERELATYAEENAIVSLNENENIVVNRMAELSELLTKATAARIKSETKLKEAESGSGVASTSLDDQSIQELRTDLKQAEAEYRALGEKFKPSYPKMVQLKARIDAIKESLKEQRQQAIAALRASYQADFQSEKALKEQLEVQKSKAFELSRRQVQYNIMKREYDSLKDLYQSVLRQLKEAQLSSESTGTNIVITERAAVPTKPSSPRRGRNIFLSLLLGPLFGIGLVILLESLDNTVKTPEDVQKDLNVAALGVVPEFISDYIEAPPDHGDRPRLESLDGGAAEETPPKDSEAELAVENTALATALKNEGELIVLGEQQAELVTVNAQRSIASEAFRTIRTGILLSSADQPPRKILVTSAKKGEGKTTLSTNLSVTLAQSSNKTILIDADLRRPNVHRTLNIDATRPGLVDYLSGQKSLEDVIAPCSLENLFIMPAGPIPPNPAELIGSKKMAEMLDMLAEQFEYVIVDSPPVMPVTDAAVLSRVTDGAILVVRGESTSTKIARDAANKLRQVGGKILGAVLNGVDFRSGYYYYYYRDTYTYYYGDGKKPSRRKQRAQA